MATDNMDVMEWLTSDVVTITRRYLAIYRREEDAAEYFEEEHAPERILVRYVESVRELLDAAMSGSGQLASAEHHLTLPE